MYTPVHTMASPVRINNRHSAVYELACPHCHGMTRCAFDSGALVLPAHFACELCDHPFRATLRVTYSIQLEKI